MSEYIVDLVCNLFTLSKIFAALILHFLYSNLKIKILDLVYSLCLIFSSSLCKMNLELRSPLLWGGSLVIHLMRKRLDWCVPRCGCLPTSSGAAVRHLLPLLGRWAGYALSPPVTWAGINMVVLLKILKGSTILLSTVILSTYISSAPYVFTRRHDFFMPYSCWLE